MHPRKAAPFLLLPRRYCTCSELLAQYTAALPVLVPPEVDKISEALESQGKPWYASRHLREHMGVVAMHTTGALTCSVPCFLYRNLTETDLGLWARWSQDLDFSA